MSSIKCNGKKTENRQSEKYTKVFETTYKSGVIIIRVLYLQSVVSGPSIVSFHFIVLAYIGNDVTDKTLTDPV